MKIGLLQGCQLPADETVEHAEGCQVLSGLSATQLANDS